MAAVQFIDHQQYSRTNHSSIPIPVHTAQTTAWTPEEKGISLAEMMKSETKAAGKKEASEILLLVDNIALIVK